MNKESTYQKIKIYLKESYKLPDNYYEYGRNNFDRMAYDYWASEEILWMLLEHCGMDYIELIESFRDQMDDFCCRANTEEATDIFLSLYEVSTSVLDFLISL